ncbi:ABC transporter permease subunit [Candidatus Sumerlaeota bacterium]|nr:ABC transporter permease subunit [Candidatus Sumerlaeota bacterium]
MKWITRYMDPITLRRLRRFRQIRRAWWSFSILLIAYAISLGSELIANDNPLYVRFEGRSYFPVVAFYPDDTFTGSGRNTRPDYKAVAASEAFRRDPDNAMIFPPCPYGPYEILDPASIEVPNEVTVTLTPSLRAGNVNIDSDYRVVRSLEADWFFGVPEGEADGCVLSDAFRVGDAMKRAIDRRLANGESPRFETELQAENAGAGAARVLASLSPYTPRSSAPRTVRITLREVPGDERPSRALTFSPELKIVGGEFDGWQNAEPEERQSVLALVEERFSVPVERRTIVLGNERYEATFSRPEVRWPYPPTGGHPLGIDEAGRDVLARILYGFRISMSFGLVLVVSAMILGVVIGAVQGYFGGWIDITGQRLIEIWSALPFLYIIILMGSVFGRGFALLIVCYGIFHWIGISYYMRGEFLRLRRQQFVEAARCLGVPTWKILFKHIFPNALVPLITLFPFSLVGAIGSLAALDYLGFGMPPPTASWGELLNQAQELRWAWWLILYPGLALFLVMLLCVFVGEGVRNAFDPRDYSGIE